MFGNYDSTKISERIERKTKDKKFLLEVVNRVTEYVGKKMLSNEIEGLVRYTQEIDYRLFVNKSRHEIIDSIAKNFVGQMRISTGSMVNTQELMKQQIGTIKSDGAESLYQKLDYPLFNPGYSKKNNNIEGYGNYGDKALNTDESDNLSLGSIPLRDALHVSEKPGQLENAATPFSSLTDKFPRIAKQPIQNIYLLLDSKYRNLSTDPSVFQWTVLNSANTSQGTVNTLSDQIHNITNVQFDRFNLPYVGSADNVYKKVSVFIEEFSSMSVLTHTGRYHMMFDSEIVGNRIQLTPLVNDEGRFRFHTPINVLDTITLTIRSPFSKVEFLPDRYNVTVTSFNSTQSILTFSDNHGVADGELVHLERFSTNNPILDSASISLMNRDKGHIVTFINNNQLRIDVDLSTISLIPAQLVDCFIATRRLIIPVRMEYLT
jgi:hypothetical protein